MTLQFRLLLASRPVLPLPAEAEAHASQLHHVTRVRSSVSAVMTESAARPHLTLQVSDYLHSPPASPDLNAACDSAERLECLDGAAAHSSHMSAWD